MVSIDDVESIDIAIDGADEVDPDLQLIKGKGAALLREKSTEILTSRFVVIVDESKIVKKLGTKDALPVEIVPFGWKQTQKRLMKYGDPVLRPSKEDPSKPYDFVFSCHIVSSLIMVTTSLIFASLVVLIILRKLIVKLRVLPV